MELINAREMPQNATQQTKKEIKVEPPYAELGQQRPGGLNLSLALGETSVSRQQVGINKSIPRWASSLHGKFRKNVTANVVCLR